MTIDFNAAEPDLLLLVNMLTQTMHDIAQGAPNPQELAHSAMTAGNILIHGLPEDF